MALLGCWTALSHIEWRSGPPTGMTGMIDSYPSFPLARKVINKNAVMASKITYIIGEEKRKKKKMKEEKRSKDKGKACVG